MTGLDWAVVASVIVLSIVAGMGVSRLASRNGAISYFTGDRNLPWWAIAISNTATYQSSSGAFVMLVLAYGLAANWLWWSFWIEPSCFSLRMQAPTSPPKRCWWPAAFRGVFPARLSSPSPPSPRPFL